MNGPALPAGRFRVFFWTQIVSLLGDGVAILAVPLLMIQLTDNALLVALSAAPRMIEYLLVGLPGGALADRLDPRVVMIYADSLRAGPSWHWRYWPSPGTPRWSSLWCWPSPPVRRARSSSHPSP